MTKFIEKIPTFIRWILIVPVCYGVFFLFSILGLLLIGKVSFILGMHYGVEIIKPFGKVLMGLNLAVLAAIQAWFCVKLAPKYKIAILVLLNSFYVIRTLTDPKLSSLGVIMLVTFVSSSFLMGCIALRRKFFREKSYDRN